MISATVRHRHKLSKAGHQINRTSSDNLKEKLIKDIYTLFAFSEDTVKSMPKSLLSDHIIFCSKTKELGSWNFGGRLS